MQIVEDIKNNAIDKVFAFFTEKLKTPITIAKTVFLIIGFILLYVGMKKKDKLLMFFSLLYIAGYFIPTEYLTKEILKKIT